MCCCNSNLCNGADFVFPGDVVTSSSPGITTSLFSTKQVEPAEMTSPASTTSIFSTQQVEPVEMASPANATSLFSTQVDAVEMTTEAAGKSRVTMDIQMLLIILWWFFFNLFGSQ